MRALDLDADAIERLVRERPLRLREHPVLLGVRVPAEELLREPEPRREAHVGGARAEQIQRRKAQQRVVLEALPEARLLAAHARDELGISENAQPKPIEAAFASALAFSLGTALPTLAAFLAPPTAIVKAVPAAALVFLVALGALGAWAGGAPMVKPALRVGFWGALAMAVTAGIGAMIGKAV